jgi:putative membrane-bound dehydrogenase-like protein
MRTLLALVLAAAPAQEKPREVASPLAPAEALREFRLDAGLVMELVASEPQIQSPVAMAFDESGRLYVVEMIDYPTFEPEKGPQGKIKLLEDKDGDRRYETSTVFAEGLLMANGVAPWKGGVVVTCAPHVLYLKDTDGDGKADLKEPWYEGFAVQNPQLRVSFPTFGMDNWLYVANGQRGGKIRASASPASAAVDIGGMDFRFDPVRGRHEPVSGFGQFGLTFDDWGQRFVCTNRNHVIHLPMPNRYFARNPLLPPPVARNDNQGAGGAARVFPISRNKTLAASHAGHFTAACGIRVYRGDLLPQAYLGAVFTCEPTGNLVRQEVLKPAGATFTWAPPREGVEFLASADNWFRPVCVGDGPDGALYVVDMYRAEVEHPEWVPADLKHRYDWKARKDLGRVWRIVPGNAPRRPAPKPLGGLTSPELAALLESPNGWTRMTAHRLLYERQDREAVEPLRKAAASANPLARVHAAWLLEGLQALDVDLAVRLLQDRHPRVRENAVRLAERWAASEKAVQERLAALADDADAAVRFQAALTLGDWNSEAVLEPLAKIAVAGADDRWTRLAVASAVPSRAGPLLERLAARTDHAALIREIAALAGARQDGAEVGRVLRAVADRDGRRQAAVLNGLADGMSRRDASLGAFLKALPDPKPREIAEALFSGAAAAAADGARSVPERQDAVRLLVHVPWESARPVLERLLGEDSPPEIRLAAVGALSAHKDPQVAPILMRSWKTYLPAMRREVLEAMARQPDRVEFLLGEIEGGRLSGGELGPTLIRQFMNHGVAKIKDRARKLLGASVEDRAQVIEKYKPALSMAGDANRGREVFQKNCASCHRVAGVGANIGPDISDTVFKPVQQMLTDILDPSRAIDNNYVNYVVRTKSGNVLNGFIAAQTAASLTLRRGENQEDTVLRQDIEEMRSTDVSVMPGNLEQGITVEQMGDLLAFLRGWRDLR